MVKLHLAAVVALTATGLAACEYVPFTPQSRIQSAKAQIAIQSSDPTTVQWSDVKEYKGAVCGTFNAEERTAAYGTENEWSGPLQFVTIDGKPTVVNNTDSDCEKGVGAWSRCANSGDEAKVTADIQACKAVQEEELQATIDQMDRFFKQDGLFQTGSWSQDLDTWRARSVQYDKSPQGMDNAELFARVDAAKVWDRAYNAHMRTLPATATSDQKVAAAPAAIAKANAATEAYLAEKGFR